MVARSDSQKTPLVVQIEMKPPDADKVKEHLEKDNESSLQQLLNEGTFAGVLRPRPSGLSADTATSLHVAARHGAEKCLKLLLNHREATEALEAPDVTGATALLVAVAEGQTAALRQLLEAKANINARDESHRSALHWLVVKLSTEQTEEQQSRLQEVADLLLSADHVNKLDLEPHASLALLSSATPLAAAAAKLRRAGGGEPWVSGLLKLCEKLVAAGASISEDAGGDATVEQVLTGKGCLTPELQRRRRSPPSRPTAAHVVDVVSMGGGGREVRDVLKGKPEKEARAAVNSRLGKDSLLWRAIDKADASLVEALLDFGADPWRTEATGELALHCAAYVGHDAIFTKLLETMKGRDTTLDLGEHTTSLVRKLMQKGRSKAGPQGADHMACLRRLLQKDVRLDLNQRDTEQTAVHVAAAFNNQEAVSELLRCGGLLGAKRLVLGRPCGTVLDSVLPATLERAMDGCVTHHRVGGGGGADEAENVVSEDYTLHLDYRFLLPPPQEGGKQEPKPVNEMVTLMEVCRSRRHRHAILHPLVQTLLYAKWRKALPLYLLNLAIYFFFVVVLTFFVYRLKDLRVLEARLARLQLNGTVDTAPVEAEAEGQKVALYLLGALLLVSWMFMLLRELFQIVFSREFYLKSIENYLEWFLLVVVVVLCAAPLGLDETRHLAAWAMIVAWYEFVLVLGRAPPLALYITMLRHVSYNFLKIIFLFSALILAFTISFNIILQPSGDDQNEDFNNFWTTLPKAIVMSTGEFEYSDLSERFPKTMLMTSAVLVFLVFLFLIFLVLMNVMNGLAVTDTQQVVEDARLYSLTSRLELVYLVETFFIYFLRRYVGKIQLLSGPDSAPSLLVKINEPKKGQRLLSGYSHTNPHKLDGDTTECLRVHRLQYLEDQKKQRCDESAARLDEAVQDLATQHPDLLRSLAAALRSGP